MLTTYTFKLTGFVTVEELGTNPDLMAEAARTQVIQLVREVIKDIDLELVEEERSE